MWRQGVRNFVAVTLPTVFLFFLLLEGLIRLFALASDVPDSEFHPGIGNHYVPVQEGIFTKGIPRQISARYRINQAGWNSPHEYLQRKADDVYRIATIGDSYVEALQVDYSQSFSYLVEEQLNKKTPEGSQVEVYSFGHADASLAQYLGVFRHVNKTYTPDLTVISLIHNDFKQSLRPYSRLDHLSLERSQSTFTEIAPQPLPSLPIKKLARKSALVRFLLLDLSMFRQITALRRRISGETQGSPQSDLMALHRQGLDREVLDYVIRQMLVDARRTNTELLFIIDADRRSLYRGEDPTTTPKAAINQTALQTAAGHGVAAIDLTSAFQKAWESRPEPFDWSIDYHWNQRGHRTVAAAVCRWIESESTTYAMYSKTEKWLSSSSGNGAANSRLWNR